MCGSEGIEKVLPEDSDDEVSTVVVQPPTERGFYKYSGGNQVMIFLLGPDDEWFAYFDNAEGPLRCDWGYIEQALGVWDLEKI